MIFRNIIIIIIILIIANEIYHGIYRQNERCRIFKMAEKQSKKIKKPLLVVGDPYYGIGSRFYNIFIDGYGCGDITVDLTGCPMCPNGIKSDIYSYLKKQDDNSMVIFISCVLEYVDNIDDVIKEIYRVGGNKDNIFIVTVNEYSLSAYFYSEDNYYAKNIIKGPPYQDNITYTKIKKI